jgi:hypothetical protein
MRAIVAEALGARTTDTILLRPLPRPFGDDRLHSELLELLNSSVLSPFQRPSDLIAQLGSLG